MSVFAYFGAAIAVLVLLIILVGVTTVALDKMQYMWQCWTWAEKRRAYQDVGQQLLYMAFDFNEHHETMLAIKSVGEELRDYDGVRIHGAVDKWHAKIDAEKRKGQK